jgi:hypothetical protein
MHRIVRAILGSLTSTSVAPPTRICGYLCGGNNRITISGTYLLEIS